MPTQAMSLRRYVAAVAVAGAVALGAVLAFPGVGQAQSDETTTTVAEETTEPKTTVPSDQSSDETRPERGDGNCDHVEEGTTTSPA
jgi:hypothetical protein